MTMPQGQSVNEAPTVAAQLQRRLGILVIATVALYLTLAGLVVVAYLKFAQQSNDTEQLAVTTTGALCALRFDLENRVHESEKFLKDHPNGIDGIPAETFQQTIEGQRRTIASLSIIECPPPQDLKIPDKR